MAKLTEEKISEIQKLYKEIGIYSQVAKMVGCSPSTVKKYAAAAPSSAEIKVEKKIFNSKIPSVQEIISFWNYKEETGELTEKEFAEIKELWKEI